MRYPALLCLPISPEGRRGLPIRFREARSAFVCRNRVKRISLFWRVFSGLFERNGIIAAGIYADWAEAGEEEGG